MRTYRLEFDGNSMAPVSMELAPPVGSQVLIRTEFTNISIGTELATIRDARRRGKPAHGLGYSLVGVIEQAGPDAAYPPGTRVLTQDPHATAVLTDGSRTWLTPIPDNLDPIHATLGTLTSVALHIVERARVNIGECAVVFGYGLVGALTTQLVRRAGAGRVLVVEPDESKWELAMRLGADRVVGGETSAIMGALSEFGYEDGADLAIEVAGHPSVFPGALEALRIGGRLVCTSSFPNGLSVTLYPAIIAKELTLLGAHQPKCPVERVPYYPFSQLENRTAALSMMADGTLKVAEFITHRVPWQEAARLYAELERGMTALGIILDWTAG